MAQQGRWEHAGVQVRVAVSLAQQLMLKTMEGTEEREGEEGGEGGVGVEEAGEMLRGAYRMMGAVEEQLHVVGCARWWERAVEVGERMGEGEGQEGKRDREEAELVRRRVEEGERERKKAREALLVQRRGWTVVTERGHSSRSQPRRDGGLTERKKSRSHASEVETGRRPKSSLGSTR